MISKTGLETRMDFFLWGRGHSAKSISNFKTAYLQPYVRCGESQEKFDEFIEIIIDVWKFEKESGEKVFKRINPRRYKTYKKPQILDFKEKYPELFHALLLHLKPRRLRLFEKRLPNKICFRKGGWSFI